MIGQETTNERTHPNRVTVTIRPLMRQGKYKFGMPVPRWATAGRLRCNVV